MAVEITKHRSPSYPAIDLGKAVERCATLWGGIRKGSTDSASALGYWGYSAKSSGGKTTLAALRKFGLVDVKQRKVSLSELARSIILDEREGSSERAAALKTAALKPTIYNEMWEKWGAELPKDSHFSHFLRKERSFGDGAIDDVIEGYKRTLAFANLTEESLSPDEREDGFGDFTEGEMDPLETPSGTPPAATKSFQFAVTLFGGHIATVKTPIPMSKRNLERLKRMIEDQLEPFVTAEDEPDPT